MLDARLRLAPAIQPDDVLLAHLGASGGDLARLVPSLAAHLTSLPEPMRADPETERYRVFEAVAACTAEAREVDMTRVDTMATALLATPG